MNTARGGTRDKIALRLQLSARSTDELLTLIGRRDPANPRRYLESRAVRDAARTVLYVRQIVNPDQETI